MIRMALVSNLQPEQGNGLCGNEEVKIDSSSEMGNIREFQKFFQEFMKTKSEESFDGLNRNLALLSSSINISEFEPSNCEVVNFFVNLHGLMSNIESRSALLWSAIAVLKTAAKNSTARIALEQKFKFLPILAKLVGCLSSRERIIRILSLIEDLTYGIIVTWQEEYLANLVKSLLGFIEKNEDEICQISLSILINLCYKNLLPVYLLTRQIHPEGFLKFIESKGIMALKMKFILESDITSLNELEVHKFIKFIFSEIEKAFTILNTGLLRHTLDFFKDLVSNPPTAIFVNSYRDYGVDVHNVLHHLRDLKISEENVIEIESQVDLPESIAMLFEIMEELLKLKGDALKPLYPEITKYAINWTHSQKTAIHAMGVLTEILKIEEGFQFLTKTFNDLETNICNLIGYFKSIPTNSEQTSAVLKLFNVVVENHPVNGVFYDVIKDFLLQRVFKSLQGLTGMESVLRMKNDDINMYLRSLVLLSQLVATSSQKPEIDAELRNLVDQKVIHFVLAKSVLSNSPDICSLVFRLSKQDSFPSKEVSESIVQQGPLILAEQANIMMYDPKLPIESFQKPSLIRTAIEKRIDDIIRSFAECREKNEIGNLVMSDVIELFEYKIAMCTKEEKELLTRLDDCNRQVTALSHKVALLSAEVSKYQSQNLAMLMTVERCKEESTVTSNENATLKASIQNYLIEIESTTAIQTDLNIEMKKKEAEVEERILFPIKFIEDDIPYVETRNKSIQSIRQNLREKLSKETCFREKYQEEIEHLRSAIKNEIIQKDDLARDKESLQDQNEKLSNLLQEANQNLSSRNTEMDALVKENLSLQDKLRLANREISENQKLLEIYARDLRDVEKMKTQVVCIMQRKSTSSPESLST